MSDFDNLVARIHADMVAVMDLDFHAQFVWGKHAADCTEHELSEARRLRDTPFGGGFAPVAAPVSSVGEPGGQQP